jgi:hypothetical protein
MLQTLGAQRRIIELLVLGVTDIPKHRAAVRRQHHRHDTARERRSRQKLPGCTPGGALATTWWEGGLWPLGTSSARLDARSRVGIDPLALAKKERTARLIASACTATHRPRRTSETTRRVSPIGDGRGYPSFAFACLTGGPPLGASRFAQRRSHLALLTCRGPQAALTCVRAIGLPEEGRHSRRG